jgi:hypothetical protein
MQEKENKLTLHNKVLIFGALRTSKSHINFNVLNNTTLLPILHSCSVLKHIFFIKNIVYAPTFD